MIEGCQKTFTPAIVEEGNSSADQVFPPKSQAGTRKVGMRQMPHHITASYMIADRLSTGSDTGEMTVRAKGEHTTTCGTTVALQIKAGRKSLEIALNITVAPETIMTASWANIRTSPRIIFTQHKNLLEYSVNKIYHQNRV
jgi:hypothetical protein